MVNIMSTVDFRNVSPGGNLVVPGETLGSSMGKFALLITYKLKISNLSVVGYVLPGSPTKFFPDCETYVYSYCFHSEVEHISNK